MENETAANEGEVEGGGNRNVGMGKGGGRLIKMEFPILFSAPHFILLRRRCIEVCTVTAKGDFGEMKPYICSKRQTYVWY